MAKPRGNQGFPADRLTTFHAENRNGPMLKTKSREIRPPIPELHDQLAITVFNTDSHRRRVHDSNHILGRQRVAVPIP